jgi:vacuolar-type H+-ATPase subunit E/Vma4
VAIEDIFRALEEQADQECNGIREQAERQAAGIASEAEENASAVRERKAQEAENAARAKMTHALNSARLASKKAAAAVKGTAVEATFDTAGEDLKGTRGAQGYDKLFSKLAREALAGVDGDIVVRVDPADEDLAKRVLSDMGVAGTVRPDLTTSGGLVVTTGNGRISRRNTLEDRLDRVRQLAQSQVAEILFD